MRKDREQPGSRKRYSSMWSAIMDDSSSKFFTPACEWCVKQFGRQNSL